MKPLDIGTAMKRVSKGVRFLDEESPDWRSEIDIDTLALESPSSCVIGQLMGNFRFHNDLGLSEPETIEFGFELDWNRINDEYDYGDYPHKHHDYSMLTECWVFAINRG